VSDGIRIVICVVLCTQQDEQRQIEMRREEKGSATCRNIPLGVALDRHFKLQGIG
jgi:hypothetical protein